MMPFIALYFQGVAFDALNIAPLELNEPCSEFDIQEKAAESQANLSLAVQVNTFCLGTRLCIKLLMKRPC